MMGAGDFPAGTGGAGIDPNYVPAVVAPFLPRAVKFDPFLKQYVLTDVNGNLIDVHPIDQIVATRLTTEAGASASAPTLGTLLRAIVARQPAAKITQLAYNEVARVLADLITNNDILLVSVVADTHTRGRNLFAVTYVNLRDPATSPRFPLNNQQTVSPSLAASTGSNMGTGGGI
jgi:hypothetical protein